jgi:hypothetical protein|tara:strand:- start:37 stop:207 length:171 start_codon:yes stop_codon:yes gene_type:complete
MTEYTDLVEKIRAKLKEEKEGRKVTFVQASNGKYTIGRKDGSLQELSEKEWLNLSE